jgi:8-oxo-dGTP pyrophosphatase MutT (NUDIX family)
MVDLDHVKEQLRSILAHRKPERVNPNIEGFTEACVLLPLFVKDGHCWLLFMRRTDTVEYHKGEVSFPGGAVDEGDTSWEHTAKRETFEEVGVKQGDIEILGQLDDMTTMMSRFIVHPFVGVVPFPYDFILNRREVERLIQVPIQFFLDAPQPQPVSIEYEGEVFETPAYVYESTIIWGATERILENFLSIITPHIQGA